jgi:hypothetical protein
MKRRAQLERSLAFCKALSGSPISFTALSIRTTASGKGHQAFNKKKSRANHEGGLGHSIYAPGTHRLEQMITNAEATAIRKLARNAGKKKSRKRKNRAFV